MTRLTLQSRNSLISFKPHDFSLTENTHIARVRIYTVSCAATTGISIGKISCATCREVSYQDAVNGCTTRHCEEALSCADAAIPGFK